MADNIPTLNDEEVDEVLRGIVDDPHVTLLNKPDGRFVTADCLRPYLGGLFTEEEVAEFQKYNNSILPMDLLPRTVTFGGSALPYRRLVYGPYDHLLPAAEKSQPVYTFRYAMHRGQTKLCAIEVEAIVKALTKHPDLKYVLYAGAAPGEHIAFLAEAFPSLEFHLVDPAEFRIQHRFKAFPSIADRIHVTRGIFTDELADEWKARAAETIFFSDIRSGDHSQDEFEHEVWKNMQMQQGWQKRAQFAACLLKFRLPYTDGSVDSKCPYLDGEILLQPYGPNTSTEGRLFAWANAKERIYDARGYENFYFWLNNVIREWASFSHGLDPRVVDGLCHCFDCSRLVEIFRGYVVLFPDVAGSFSSVNLYIAYLIGRMIEPTGQRLAHPPHGVRVDDLPISKRDYLAAKYGNLYVRNRRAKIRAQSKKVQYAAPVVQPHVRPPLATVAAAAAVAPTEVTPTAAAVTAPSSLDSIVLAPAKSFRRTKKGNKEH